MKNVIAVLAGIGTGMVTIFIMEMISSFVYSMPAGLNLNDAAAMKRWMEELPIGAYLLVLAGYAFGSLDGGIMATLISGRQSPKAALIVGTVLLVGGIANLVMLPQPLWFVIVSSLIYIPFAYLGFLLMRRRTQ